MPLESGFGGGGSSGTASTVDHDHSAVAGEGSLLYVLAPETQSAKLGSTFSTTSVTLVDITGITLTVITRTNGKFMMNAVLNIATNAVNNTSWAWVDDGTVGNEIIQHVSHAGNEIINMNHVGDLDGQVVKIQCKVTSTTLHVTGGATQESKIEVLQV